MKAEGILNQSIKKDSSSFFMFRVKFQKSMNNATLDFTGLVDILAVPPILS